MSLFSWDGFVKLITKGEPAAAATGDSEDKGSRVCPATVVVGLGNDLLSDDGVGLYVARRLRERLAPDRYKVIELSVGGMGLVDHLVGYRRAVVIDACRTGRRPPGTLSRHRPEDFANSPRLASYHTIDFATALELARQFGADLPERMAVFAIEVEDVETIHEGCTPRVEARVETAAEQIARILEAEETQAAEMPSALADAD